MNRLVTVIMYLLWILNIIAVLATTFTNFRYLDLNMIALVLFGFALINSFFAISKRK